MPRLSRSFYQRDPVTLAHALLGQLLVRIEDDGSRTSGRIVEVEAYLGEVDRAAHTFARRRSPRNNSMYLDGGRVYVYFTYGMHFCMNVVADTVDVPTACLLRAIEPVEGVETMRRRRSGRIAASKLKQTQLCSGPAKLTQAMGVDRGFDGVDLVTSDRLFIERRPGVSASRIVTAARIGVGYAQEWAARPLRFYERDNPHVSTR